MKILHGFIIVLLLFLSVSPLFAQTENPTKPLNVSLFPLEPLNFEDENDQWPLPQE